MVSLLPDIFAKVRCSRNFRPLWLIWVGEEMPYLHQFWHQYLRRFAIDHWYRFIKQRWHWTLPHFATPEQCQRWSDLMPLLSWQLWLARSGATDCPLPQALALQIRSFPWSRRQFLRCYFSPDWNTSR